MKWTSEKSAGIAYMLPVIFMGVAWYILLFSSHLPNANYSETLRTWFFEVPERKYFWLMAFLPIFSLAMAAAYFFGLGRVRVGAAVLCAAGILVCAATWLLLDATLAASFTLPLLFAVPRTKWHRT